jgi:predicted small lipoprotein YifL
MRKVLLVVTAALLAVTIVAAGCGKKNPTEGNAQKLIKDSNKAMQSLKSYKAVGSINISSSVVSQGATSVSFEMQIQQNGPKDFQGHMMISALGKNMEVYIANGYVYTNDPEKGWVKQPLSSVSDFSTLASPADISKLGDAATNARILTEDSQYYKIAFDLNADYLKQLMGSQASNKNLSSEEKKIADEMLKGMQMGAIFKLEKSTMYINSMVMNFNIQNVPSAGKLKMEEKIDLSEFNKPVEVNLPAEAQNAQEVTGSGALTPTL